MRRVQTTPIVRIPSGNTPLRTRHESSMVPPNILTHRPHKESSLQTRITDVRSLSPNKLQATKKPLISPKVSGVERDRHQQPRRKGECVNHHGRQSEYKITVSGETMYYCERCAAQLASQGFKVERVYNSRPIPAKKSYISSNSQFEGNPRAAEIADFLENLRMVDRCMKDNNRVMMDLQQHYSLQIRQLEEFYNQIVCYVNYIRNEHVGILKEECRRYVQLGLMECGTNEQNLEQVNNMAEDIESQMEIIVTQISEEHFRKCFNEYNKQMEMFKHRLEQQNNTLSQITDVRTDELDAKLNQCKRALCELLGVKEQGMSSNNFSFEIDTHTHTKVVKRQIPGKENRNPFRNLFSTSNEGEPSGLPDESPHFKPF